MMMMMTMMMLPPHPAIFLLQGKGSLHELKWDRVKAKAASPARARTTPVKSSF